MLGKKYGKELLKRAMQDEGACVNQKVVERLRYQYNAPPTSLKEVSMTSPREYLKVFSWLKVLVRPSFSTAVPSLSLFLLCD